MIGWLLLAALGLAVWSLLALGAGVLIGRGIHLAHTGGPRHTPGTPMRGGQVLMGPAQPRPRLQAHIPAPPPRGATR